MKLGLRDDDDDDHDATGCDSENNEIAFVTVFEGLRVWSYLSVSVAQ